MTATPVSGPPGEKIVAALAETSGRPTARSDQTEDAIVCREWLRTGQCKRGNCTYRHYLTNQVCKYWLQGTCPADDTCIFSHDNSGLKSPAPLKKTSSATPYSPETAYPSPEIKEDDPFQSLNNARADTDSNESQSKARSRRRTFAKPFSGSWVKPDPVMTEEEEAEQILLTTERLLRPIFNVFKHVIQIVEQTIRQTEERFRAVDFDKNELGIVESFGKWYSDVTTVQIEPCLAQSPKKFGRRIFMRPLTFLLLNELNTEFYGDYYCSDYIGRFLLDRSSMLPVQERERRKKCVVSMSKATENLAELVVEARAALLFERDVMDGVGEKIIDLDKFFNRAHESFFNFGKRRTHIGYSIYKLSKNRDCPEMRYFNAESIGHFEDKGLEQPKVEQSALDDLQVSKGSDKSILISVVTLGIIIATVFGYLAWRLPQHSKDGVKDPGFWCNLQNGLLQIITLVPFLTVDLRGKALPWSTRVWARAVVTVSLTLTITSIPLFVFYPRWSSVVAFFGNVGQVIYAVQLPLAWQEQSLDENDRKKRQ